MDKSVKSISSKKRDLTSPSTTAAERLSRIRRKFSKDNLKKGCKSFLHFVFTTGGLCLLVVLYSFLGGLMFAEVEKYQEQKKQEKLQEKADDERTDVIGKMGNECLEVDLKTNTSQWMLAMTRMLTLLQTKTQNITSDGWDGSYPGEEIQLKWGMVNAVLFAITIITTIGYGHIAPKTDLGMILCLAYAVFGVPILLLYLANIGSFMADVVRYMYHHFCCELCWEKRCKKRKSDILDEDLSSRSSNMSEIASPADESPSLMVPSSPDGQNRSPAKTGAELSARGEGDRHLNASQNNNNDEDVVTLDHKDDSEIKYFDSETGNAQVVIDDANRGSPTNDNAANTMPEGEDASQLRKEMTTRKLSQICDQTKTLSDLSSLRASKKENNKFKNNKNNNNKIFINSSDGASRGADKQKTHWDYGNNKNMSNDGRVQETVLEVDADDDLDHGLNLSFMDLRELDWKTMYRHKSVPVSMTVLIMISYLFIGAMIFSLWENWTFPQALYFSFITLTTIGLGDLVPGLTDDASWFKQALCAIYVLLGMALIAMCMDLMMAKVKTRVVALAQKVGIMEKEEEIKRRNDAEAVFAAIQT